MAREIRPGVRRPNTVWYLAAAGVGVVGLVVYSRRQKARQTQTAKPTYTVPSGYGGFMPGGGGGGGGGAGIAQPLPLPTIPTTPTGGPTLPSGTPAGTSTMPTTLTAPAAMSTGFQTYTNPATGQQYYAQPSGATVVTGAATSGKTSLANLHQNLAGQTGSYTPSGYYLPKSATFTK